MPETTVVIPTYNRADVLQRAMDSVLGQTVRDLELVVVDDGSTDDTQGVVESYDDDRVRYVAHETNRGANVARNTGIEAAAGQYVAFLDSDDEWHPRKLEAQLERLHSPGSEWAGAYCDTTTQAEGASGRFQRRVADLLAAADEERTTEGSERLADEILADNVQPAAGSTLVVETGVARSVGGFDEELDRFQDPEFVLRILEEGPLAYVEEPLVIRHDTGSPSPDDIRAADEQYLAKHAEAVERAEARGLDVRGAHALVLAKAYLSAGQFGASLHHLIRADVPLRHLPGLLWTIGIGARRRVGDRSLALGVAALVAVGCLAVYYSRHEAA
jgi:glycosyltransferase involved in cell wall biosynthesis